VIAGEEQMKIGKPIQIASLTSIPWKNGGGITRNLAIEPEGADFDNFLWRLSFAEINEAGSFSTFPGVDRSILVWKGNGLLLHSNGGGVFVLTSDTEPHSFRGEDEIEATLIDGPTIDFNLMVRRGCCTAAVNRYRSEIVIACGARQAFFLCAAGSFRLHFLFDQEFHLRSGESLPVSYLREGVKISPDATDALMIVALIDWPEPAAATND
jgi:environmental stress-induced protein Ves